jgi:hypothetical protein
MLTDGAVGAAMLTVGTFTVGALIEIVGGTGWLIFLDIGSESID